MFETSIELPQNVSNKEVAVKMLQAYKDKLDLSLDEENWFNQMKEVAVECGYAATPKEWKKNKEAFPGHVGDLASLLRMVTSLRFQSPNLYYIMQILGYEEVINRLNKVIEHLSK